MSGEVLCLIGGQYGSEGKGVIAHHLAGEYGVHVRVGGPNAGHTFRNNGRIWKMRSLPCGWVNPDATLIIGAGAIFDPELLAEEIHATLTSPKRVWVDPRAVVIEPADRSGPYSLKETIGATGEGVGPARIRRMWRGVEPVRTAWDLFIDGKGKYPWRVADASGIINRMRLSGANVLLEGTQGALLSLIHGPWPYVTSADTGAAQLLADCGVPPTANVKVLMTIRTFPIRVGGHSGPLPNETTWEKISELIGKKVEEFTTVTKRLRRVGFFEASDVEKAIGLNGPDGLAVMFMDYLFPTCEGMRGWDELPSSVQQATRDLEQKFGVPVKFIGTGGPDFAVVEVPYDDRV